MNRAFSAAFLNALIPWDATQAANECCTFGAKYGRPFGTGPTASFRCDLSVARNIGALGDNGEWRIESKIYHNFIAFVA
jgi:hypothetical protein